MGEYPTHKLGPLVISYFFLFLFLFLISFLSCGRNVDFAETKNESLKVSIWIIPSALCSPRYSTEHSIVAIHPSSLSLLLSCWVKLTGRAGQGPRTRSCIHLPLPCLIAREASALEPFPEHYLISWQQQPGPWLHFQSVPDALVDGANPVTGEANPDPVLTSLPINSHISLFNWLRYGKTVGGLTFGKSFSEYSKTVFFIMRGMMNSKRILISTLFPLSRRRGVWPPPCFIQSVI